MNGKDLLAVLVMILPSLLLIGLIAISLIPPADIAAAPPGAALERNNADKVSHVQSGAKTARAAGGASARARRDATTQDMIGDFWGRPHCANCVRESESARCNSSAHDDGISC